MKKSILLTAILGSSLSLMAHADLRLDAALEVDTDVVKTKNSSTTFDQNGFVELSAFGKRERGEYFIAAKGTARLHMDGGDALTVEDAYLQLGTAVWDVQLGRFEAMSLFPTGKDTQVVHAGGVSVYGANKARGRAGNDGGQLALHVNPSENLRFEIATIYGDDDTAGDNNSAISGIRPAMTWKTDGFSLSAGFERVSYDLTAGGSVDQTGFGIAANFDVGAANVNLAATRLNDDNAQDVTSYTANMTYGNFGAGVIYSKEDSNLGADPEVLTTYMAYTLPVFDIENASVTFAGSYSKADNVVDDEALAGRVRFNYAF